VGAVVQFGAVVGFVRPKRSEGSFAREKVAGDAPKRGAGSRGPDLVLLEEHMVELYKLLDVVAPTSVAVLVLGETGVGKDVFAETLHARSARAGKPLLRLNCAALPESILEAELFGYERGAFTGAVQAKAGLFEAADGGTVFLDEVGDMPLLTQAKLLRVLESGEVMRLGSLKTKRVDVRFVSATNRELEALVAVERFRSDLFFRINGVTLTIPPLRKRPADVVALVKRFAVQAAEKFRKGPVSLEKAAMEKLTTYPWPGNIRELRNVVERAVLTCKDGSVGASDVTLRGGEHGRRSVAPAASSGAATKMKDTLADVERQRILDALEAHDGNRSRAARALGIARSTLLKRLASYRAGGADDDEPSDLRAWSRAPLWGSSSPSPPSRPPRCRGRRAQTTPGRQPKSSSKRG
jgi:transcriptional regulator with PAS, ATPase and Fis domain